MIIVSQDKGTILNFENIQNIKIEKYGTHIKSKKIYKIFSGNFEGYETELGTYETEERAKKILRKIIDTYCESNEELLSTGYGYVKNNVYEMPED